MNLKKAFFRCCFIYFMIIIAFNVFFVFTILFFNNPFNLSFHPVFYTGVLFGIALSGSIYLGWGKE